MVGCWNVGLKMIPNDRARSSLGSPGDFSKKTQKINDKSKCVQNKKSKNHDFSHVAPYKRLGPKWPTTYEEPGKLKSNCSL